MTTTYQLIPRSEAPSPAAGKRGPRSQYQEAIDTVLLESGLVAQIVAPSKRAAYVIRQSIRRTARSMGVSGRLMVWAEKGKVYLAKRLDA